jgi:hypothetical protein
MKSELGHTMSLCGTVPLIDEADRGEFPAPPESMKCKNCLKSKAQSLAYLIPSIYKAFGEIQDLINSSEGVAGYHLNGDMAPWEELLKDGKYECLGMVDEVIASLSEL